MTANLSLITAIFATLLTHPISSQEASRFSAADELQIMQAVGTVKEAIVKKNITQLLQQVSREGLTCTDTSYSAQRVQTFLENKKSHLYMSLFDSDRFSGECGDAYPLQYPAISDQEFLKTANDSVTIIRLDANWAQVTLTSANSHHYPREWSFHKENGTWKLAAHSLVIGRCTCG